MILYIQALERFGTEAPGPDDKTKESVYDKKVEDLERALDAPLNVLYLKQLGLLREKALKNFKSALTNEGSEYEAMMQADDFFRREAEDSTRQNPDWDYMLESNSLKSSMSPFLAWIDLDLELNILASEYFAPEAIAESTAC